MQYGFVIDHSKCIGCHACTVACKAENEVPVGNFRTWVKYTEVGEFPQVRRHFGVLRCNHCTDAPCVTICPVNALEKRVDGIVDIDRDACIGCRACMQACPYDAIYLNDDTGAVEKCHFCAHRVERGLEPACAVVCPEQAIIAGDLDDGESDISLLIMNNATQVRRPEQGTGPNVHYIEAHETVLVPGIAREEEMYLWSDKPKDRPPTLPEGHEEARGLALRSRPRHPNAEPAPRNVLDVGHRVEWGWPVSLYLVTKGIASGVAMLTPFAAMLGVAGAVRGIWAEVIALVFTLITCALLVEDLKRPWKFYRLFTRPNWSSWLVKGGIALALFQAGLAAAIACSLLGIDGAVEALRWPNALLGACTAGYTAFLFAQCKGRDLWESNLLLPHLLLQAVACGGVILLTLHAFLGSDGEQSTVALAIVTLVALIGHAAIGLLERYGSHETLNAKQAAAYLGTVRLGPSSAFRDGLIVGVVLTAVLLFVLPALAIVPALVGLYLYEHAYIRAGQLPPLS